MKPGKIAESVMKRSVFKQLKTKRDDVILGADVGADCSFFSWERDKGVLLCTSPVEIKEKEDISIGIVKALNNIGAAGGEAEGVMISSLLSEDTTPDEMEEYMKEARKTADSMGIIILGGNTSVTSYVNGPIFDLTIIGKKMLPASENEMAEKYEDGEDIIMTKWTGLYGTSVLAKQQEAFLEQTMPASLIHEGKRFKEMISVLPESRIGVNLGVSGMHDVSRGGIFAALWELAESDKKGFTVDLKSIPIRQETIEICERLKINPYELEGSGSLLMVTKEKDKLLHALKEAGIPASAIGKMTKSKGKFMINGEDTRCLDRPVRDSMYF